MGKNEPVKVDLEELHEFLDDLFWQLTQIAAEHKDRRMLELAERLDKFVDRAVFGKLT